MRSRSYVRGKTASTAGGMLGTLSSRGRARGGARRGRERRRHCGGACVTGHQRELGKERVSGRAEMKGKDVGRTVGGDVQDDLATARLVGDD